jgi:hypothetical protein
MVLPIEGFDLADVGNLTVVLTCRRASVLYWCYSVTVMVIQINGDGITEWHLWCVRE